jgi:hypothetical protein
VFGTLKKENQNNGLLKIPAKSGITKTKGVCTHDANPDHQDTDLATQASSVSNSSAPKTKIKLLICC